MDYRKNIKKNVRRPLHEQKQKVDLVKIYRKKGIEWDNEPLTFSELLMYFLENDYNGGVINIWFDEDKEYLFQTYDPSRQDQVMNHRQYVVYSVGLSQLWVWQENDLINSDPEKFDSLDNDDLQQYVRKHVTENWFLEWEDEFEEYLYRLMTDNVWC